MQIVKGGVEGMFGVHGSGLSSLPTKTIKRVDYIWGVPKAKVMAPLATNSLARPSKSLDIQRRRLDLSVCWHAFILSPIEEVLAFVADKSPFSKSATGICARRHGGADWACAEHRLDIDVL